jgi:hypothetical protein
MKRAPGNTQVGRAGFRNALRTWGTREQRKQVFGRWRHRRTPSAALRVRLIADAIMRSEEG